MAVVLLRLNTTTFIAINVSTKPHCYLHSFREEHYCTWRWSLATVLDILVSNRLSLSIHKHNGKYKAAPSTGGLMGVLRGLNKANYLKLG